MQAKVWTDGSFKVVDKLGIYGGGAVLFVGNDPDPWELKIAGDDRAMARHQNVTGECLIVMKVVEHITKNMPEVDSIAIYHDYNGCSKFLDGSWPNAKSAIAISYKGLMMPILKEGKVKISFIWTKGHNGDVWNERADNLAAEAISEFAKNKRETDKEAKEEM